MILYVENPKDFPRTDQNPVKTNKFSSRVGGYKINTQKSGMFLYTYNKQSEKEVKKTISFTIAWKKLRDKLNQVGKRCVH